MSDREPLSGADNAWRRMGSPNNLMTITGVMVFDEVVPYDEFCDRLEARLLRFDRFKQSIGGRNRTFRRPYWQTLESMDVRTHVYDVALPEPADKDEFERFISNLISRPLDERRPLWEAYLIENAGTGDGNAVAFRLNHSIGDGFALLSVLLGLVDDPDGIELPFGGLPKPPTVDEGRSDSSSSTNGQSQTDVSGTAQGSDGKPRTQDSKSGISSELHSLVESAKYAVQGVKSGYNLLTMGHDAWTSLHGPIGTKKRVAWTDEVALTLVKRIGRAHDTTVNDVLLGATAGGLRRVFEQRDEPTEGLEVRCTMPVNLKGVDERDTSLGNHFGLAFIPIPVGIEELEERIRTIRQRTTKRRVATEAYLMYLLLQVGGYLPNRIQQLGMEFFERRSLGVVTNVPGPTNTLEFAGREVSDVMFWVPQSIDQGLGISIFSYDGGVRMGVNSDVNLLAEPRILTDALEAEIEMLAENIE